MLPHGWAPIGFAQGYDTPSACRPELAQALIGKSQCFRKESGACGRAMLLDLSANEEAGMNRLFKRLLIGAGMAVMLCTAVSAQWSIGKPGTREAPRGQNRYAYLVMADPLPGREFDFNDGYQNMHMGDLVQLPGWTGAQ